MLRSIPGSKHILLALLIVLTLAVMLTSGCTYVLAEPATTVAAEDSAPRITVDLTADQVTAPTEWPSGVVEVTFQNSADEAVYADLARLAPDTTMADLQAVVQDPVAGLELIDLLGGPLVGAQASVQATYDLEPGNYVVLLITETEEMPMTALTVVAADNATPQPQSDVAAELRDFAFVLPDEIQAGPQVWQIRNEGEQWHHMAIVQLDEGLTTADVITMLMSEEGPEGPPPFTEIFLWEAMEPGAAAWTTIDLAPGEYTVICFLPDFSQEPVTTHAVHGMVRTLRVVE